MTHSTADGALIGVSFERTNLSGQILNRRYIGANFHCANLSQATLNGDFINVNMQDAALSGAALVGSFTMVDFRNTGIFEQHLAAAARVTQVWLSDGRVYSR